MLVKIFAALSAIATVLTVALTALAETGWNLLWIVPLLLIGYFLASNALYVLLMYLGTQFFIDLNKPQSRPSKFCRWHLDQIAKTACLYFGAKIHVTGVRRSPPTAVFSSSATTGRSLTLPSWLRRWISTASYTYRKRATSVCSSAES